MILLSDSSWEIKQTPSKGKGIFAAKSIVAGKVVGDYIGRVIKTAQEDTSEKDGLYLMYYHDYASLYPIDKDAPGIHLMNHSCAPNCGITVYRGHTLFFALRAIFPGEELTVSYQLSPDTFCTPCRHQCRCNFAMCTGTMHLSQEEFKRWQTFQESQAKETKRAPIRYGKTLPLLSHYPETINDHPIYTLFGALEHEPLTLTNDDLKLPQLRYYMRDSGKRLFIKKQHKIILGFKNNTVVTA